MKKRRGEADGGFFAAFGFAAIVGVVSASVGYNHGWDAGVRDAVAGRATVIEKPDGTTEAVKAKAVAERMEDDNA